VCELDSDSRDYDVNRSECDSRVIRDVITAERRDGTRDEQRRPVIQRLDSHTRLVSHLRLCSYLRLCSH
jgi:hypothetical protein